MGFWSKVLLGGLGWSLGGPLGAIIGVIIAGMISGVTIKSIGDDTSRNNDGAQEPHFNDFSKQQKSKTTKGDFLIALMVLAGSVMKADGKVVKSELEEVKSFLRSNFTEEEGKDALQILKKILDSNYSYRDICAQIRVRLNYSGKLELVHLLFKIASADGEISQSEINTIYDMCSIMGVSNADYSSIKAAYRTYTSDGYKSSTRTNKTLSIDEAYSILEIDKKATDEEVKKAYRRMAMKYHPDKVNNLGEEIKKSATEKFKAVGEAYQMIKDARGFK